MPRKRIDMRKIREVLRLRQEMKMSVRSVAAACGLSYSAVIEYGYRAAGAGIQWPLPEGLTDETLEGMLYPPRTVKEPVRPVPDWSVVRSELARKGVTLSLLWREYKLQHIDGYNYSRFVEMYREWEGAHSYSMIQSHRPGEKLFVDYSGMTMNLTDPETGDLKEVQIFVAATGYAQLLFVRACLSQKLRDWLDCHVHTFEFLGGLLEVVVPDNLKSAVKKPCRYEPETNPAYADLARHYGIIVLPARALSPKDKAKVENGVLQVERWVLAPLRDRTFFKLEELQGAIDSEVALLNDRKLTGLPLSRREIFEAEERPKLKDLPARRYEFAEWKKAKVGPDYHVRFESQAYSVPHRFCKKEVEIRLTVNRVEIFLEGKSVAGHDRGISLRHVSTMKEHMPRSHREYAEWTPERLTRWASEFGPCTGEFVRVMLSQYAQVEYGFRSAFGIFSLSKKFGADRLERACSRALRAGASRYSNVKTILEKGLDALEIPDAAEPSRPPHANVRGKVYYKEGLN
jgi:transposase